MPPIEEVEVVQKESEEAHGHVAAQEGDVFVPMCCCVDVMQLSTLN